MVVVVILSLIILGLVTFFTGGARSWVAGQSQLTAQRNARQAIDRMVREIREGKNITTGSETSITVRVPYFDANGNIASYNDVNYYWSENTWKPINRIVSSGTNALINNVLSLAFTYFDSSGNLVTPENTSKVHINLQVDIDRDSNPDITLNTDVNLRNFGLQE
jgi:type II secretory pathway pseudopilin PulG